MELWFVFDREEMLLNGFARRSIQKCRNWLLEHRILLLGWDSAKEYLVARLTLFCSFHVIIM